MIERKKIYRRGRPALIALLLSTVFMAPDVAFAQNVGSGDIESQLLIAILVKKGVISKSDGESIIRQARNEAAAIQARPAPSAVAAAVPSPAVPAIPMPNEVATTGSDGAVHVTYIPPMVRQQIAQQVEQQVLTTEQTKDYAAPNEVPDWVHRIKIYGDIRTRYESDMYPSGNDIDGDLPNFNAINTGSPYDITNANNFPPQLNANAERNRFRLRARLGVNADLGDGWTVGFRLATGENDSPVSENQSFGVANNAQGGDFSKYAIWLDRAYIAYTLPKLDPDLDLSFQVGRFDNPFFHTPLIWADDLGFDGIVGTGDYKFDSGTLAGLTPFLTLGAFPVFNTDFNFASNQPDKFSSEDKYMFAAQGGAAYKFDDDYSGKLAVADYAFTNMAGKLSAPCVVLSTADSCSTDDDRPSFAQNGNTYMALRNIVPIPGAAADGGNENGTIDQYQYFGLAANFNELALTGEFDVDNFDPTAIWVDGEYVRNLAFNRADIASKAVNNRGAISAISTTGDYDGGNEGYFINVSIGQKELKRLWDWNASLGYRYLESDAEVDAFDDSDFGLGGTNLKGYTLRGNLALTPAVFLRATYMSADSIAGPTYDIDLFQLDLNAKF